jgi:CubicO group peptidase (beta-lactamase class C family)
MICQRLALLALVAALIPFQAAAQSKPRSAVYYPDTVWQRKTPAESGINPQLLKAAIDHATASETRNPRDLTLNHYQTFGREPFGYAIGPIKNRGDQTGVVIHKGYIVAEWGEPLPSAPASAFMHIGNGTNAIYVDPENDIVAVLRWIDRPAIDEVVKRLIAAVRPQ